MALAIEGVRATLKKAFAEIEPRIVADLTARFQAQAESFLRMVRLGLEENEVKPDRLNYRSKNFRKGARDEWQEAVEWLAYSKPVTMPKRYASGREEVSPLAMLSEARFRPGSKHYKASEDPWAVARKHADILVVKPDKALRKAEAEVRSARESFLVRVMAPIRDILGDREDLAKAESEIRWTGERLFLGWVRVEMKDAASFKTDLRMTYVDPYWKPSIHNWVRAHFKFPATIVEATSAGGNPITGQLSRDTVGIAWGTIDPKTRMSHWEKVAAGYSDEKGRLVKLRDRYELEKDYWDRWYDYWDSYNPEQGRHYRKVPVDKWGLGLGEAKDKGEARKKSQIAANRRDAVKRRHKGLTKTAWNALAAGEITEVPPPRPKFEWVYRAEAGDPKAKRSIVRRLPNKDEFHEVKLPTIRHVEVIPENFGWALLKVGKEWQLARNDKILHWRNAKGDIQPFSAKGNKGKELMLQFVAALFEYVEGKGAQRREEQNPEGLSSVVDTNQPFVWAASVTEARERIAAGEADFGTADVQRDIKPEKRDIKPENMPSASVLKKARAKTGSKFKLTDRLLSDLEVYVLDPIHEGDHEKAAFRALVEAGLHGNVLTIPSAAFELARESFVQLSNEVDKDSTMSGREKGYRQKSYEKILKDLTGSEKVSARKAKPEKGPRKDPRKVEAEKKVAEYLKTTLAGTPDEWIELASDEVGGVESDLEMAVKRTKGEERKLLKSALDKVKQHESVQPSEAKKIIPIAERLEESLEGSDDVNGLVDWARAESLGTTMRGIVEVAERRERERKAPAPDLPPLPPGLADVAAKALGMLGGGGVAENPTPTPERRLLVLTEDGQIVFESDDPDEIRSESRGKDWQWLAPETGRDAVSNPPLTPERALALAQLAPITESEVCALTLKEAFAKVEPFFEAYTSQDIFGVRPKTLSGLLQPTKGLLRPNEKMHKVDASKPPALTLGLSLMPEASVFKGKTEAGLDMSLLPPITGKSRNATLCAGSSSYCRTSCLVFTGQNLTALRNNYAKLAATKALLCEPAAFVRLLLGALARYAGSTASAVGGSDASVMRLVRLNVFSDVPWEVLCPWLFTKTAFDCADGPQDISRISFYDYTKVPGRVALPRYDLTYSYSGTPWSLRMCDEEMRERGRRVAMVFIAAGYERKAAIAKRARQAGVDAKEVEALFLQANPLPSIVRDPGLSAGSPIPVVDGDRSDIRPFDPPRVIVGLRWKTPYYGGAKPPSGFVVSGEVVGETERGPVFRLADAPLTRPEVGVGNFLEV